MQLGLSFLHYDTHPPYRMAPLLRWVYSVGYFHDQINNYRYFLIIALIVNILSYSIFIVLPLFLLLF